MIGLVVMLSGILFYWFEYRPSQIKKNCWSFASGLNRGAEETYRGCLRDHGLEE
jgi:hypothetical protein